MTKKVWSNLIKRARALIFAKILLEAFFYSLLPLSLFTAFYPVYRNVGYLFLILSGLTFIASIILRGSKELKQRRIGLGIEQTNPFLKERLISLLELEEDFPQKEGYALFFKRRLEDEIKGLLPKIHLFALFSPNIWSLRIVPISLFVAFLAFLIHPGPTTAWMTGLKETAILLPKPSHLTTLTFKPETLYVEALGVKGIPYLIGDGNFKKITRPVARDLYRASFRFAKEGNYSFYFESDGARSKEVTANVLRSPSIDSVTLRIVYPPYTGWQSTESRERILSILEDSKINLKAFFDADSISLLNKDSVKISTSDSPLLWVSRVKEDMDLSFVLFRGGKAVKSDRKLTILVIPDSPPSVKFLGYYGEMPMPEDMQLQVKGLAEDDIGLKKIYFLREFKGKKERKILRNYTTLPLLDTFSTIVSLGDLPLLPGDEVELMLEAMDTRGQKAISEPIRVRLPTPAELYENAEEASQSGEGKAESLTEKTRELSQRLEKVEELLKENKRLDWSQKEKLKKVVESEKELLGNIQNQLKEMSNSLNEVEKTYSFSPELIKKISEVRQLFEEVMTEEMREALQKLEKAIGQLKPEDVRKALSELKIDQEAMKRNLERLANILKRFKQETELKRLAEIAKKLTEEEKALSEKISHTESPDSLMSLSKEQKSVRQQLDSLTKDVSSLQNQLKKSDKEIADSLMNLTRKDVPNTENEMQSTMSSLSKGLKSSAYSASQGAGEKMGKIAEKLSNLSNLLESLRLNKLASDIAKLRRQTIFLSLFQEDVLKGIENMRESDSLAHMEEGVREGTDQVTKDLVKLLETSLLLNPQIAAILSEASHNALRAQESLEGRNPERAKRESMQALNYLNLAALALLQAEKQCKSSCKGGSSTGLEQALQKLSQMAQKQASINGQTQSFIPMPVPMPKQELAQLAAQQEAIEGALRKLSQSLGREGSLLRALEKASAEAKEVAKRIKEGNINKELLRKQEKILARMLEAQKSIHKQEFSRIRRSTPGKTFKPVPPAELEIAKKRERIRRGYLEMQNPSVPQGYKSLIKAYFESLLKE